MLPDGCGATGFRVQREHTDSQHSDGTRGEYGVAVSLCTVACSAWVEAWEEEAARVPFTAQPSAHTTSSSGPAPQASQGTYYLRLCTDPDSKAVQPKFIFGTCHVAHLGVHPQCAPRVQEQHTWQRLGHRADAGPLPQRPRHTRPWSRRLVAPWCHSS